MAIPFLQRQGKRLEQRFGEDDPTRLRLKYEPYYHTFHRQVGSRVWQGDREYVMLASNDYLGLGNHPLVIEAGKEALDQWGSGTTGARLANGSRSFHLELEEQLADFLGKEACHVSSAGYLSCMSAVASFVGATIAIIGLTLFAPLLARVAVMFGPAEFFALMIFAFASMSVMMGSDPLKTGIAAVLGVMIAMIGVDSSTGVLRYTFDMPELYDGIDFVVLIIGLFAVSELIIYSARGGTTVTARVAEADLSWQRQTLQGIRDVLSRPVKALRAAGIGAGIGIIPGLGGGVAAFLSYIVGMQTSRDPDYGQGSVEGVIAGEVANDAKDGGALLPTITFGIPGSGDMAVLLGAFVLHGLEPGPQRLCGQAAVTWSGFKTPTSASRSSRMVTLAPSEMPPFVAPAQ